jgi:hypothetical protein
LRIARRYPRRRVRHAEPTTKWQKGHEAETKIEKKKIEAALEVWWPPTYERLY